MKRSWKKMTGLFMAAALGVSLMGFTSEAKSTEGAADAAESLNETKEMVLGSVRDMIPGEGDAFYVNLSAQVWEPLVINNNHKLEPGLAESWETNDDCTEWTFHLVENASFTDGVKFDADACMKILKDIKQDH